VSIEGISDEALIAAAQLRPNTEEASSAASELFRRYSSQVALWCARFTGDRDSADDLTQDIFLKVYRSLDSFRGNSKFSTWLYAVTRNRCLDEVKSRIIDLDSFGEAALADLPDRRHVDVQTALENESSLKTMRALMKTALDETEQKVLMLHYGHGYPIHSVTRLLGLQNSSGAKAYIVRAKRSLQGVVRQWKTSRRAVSPVRAGRPRPGSLPLTAPTE
jgi:RNA polymerase sigma factor (sigma-70 family)